MTSIDLNSMTAMNLDGLPTKIAVNDLNVWYGKFHALKHITLAIPEGRVTAFIGPSGCGKSTLLRTFNRMYALYPGQRAEGELMLDGVNILSGTIDDCTLMSRVGMVFQSLSGGQQQRLCIARGVAVKPEVLLLDEPCSALDPISTARIEELIEELKNDYTVVIVAHSMQQAARVSDYTAFLYLGELIETGPTTDIFTRPQKKATEDYITGRFG